MNQNPGVETEQIEVQNSLVESNNLPETLPTEEQTEENPIILDELVIEEVNIDGMCGVY